MICEKHPELIDYHVLRDFKKEISTAPDPTYGRKYSELPLQALKMQLDMYHPTNINWIRAKYNLAIRGGLKLSSQEIAVWLLDLTCLPPNKRTWKQPGSLR